MGAGRQRDTEPEPERRMPLETLKCSCSITLVGRREVAFVLLCLSLFFYVFNNIFYVN